MTPSVGENGSVKPPTLRTGRLLLRRWRGEDRPVFAQISADEEVVRYRLAPLTRDQSDALIDEIETSFDRNGFGLWAVERIQDRSDRYTKPAAPSASS